MPKKKEKKEKDTGEVSFKTIRDRFNREHGISCKSRDALVAKIDRIPTGIFKLDWALYGGFPTNRLTLVWGRKGCAKSTTLLKLAATYQKMCGNCIRYDADCKCKGGPVKPMVHLNDVENAFDPRWAEAIGLDMSEDRFDVECPEWAEEGIDLFAAVCGAKDVGLAIMDSVAMLTPSEELAHSTMDWQQGLGARLTNKMVRVLNSAFSTAKRRGRKLTIVLVNQPRMVISQHGPGGETMPGGLGQVFAASVVLRMMQSKPGGFGENEPEREAVEEEAGKKAKHKAYIDRPAYTDIKALVQYSKTCPVTDKDGIIFRMALKSNANTHTRIGDTDDLNDVMYRGREVGYIHKEDKGWVAGDGMFSLLEDLKEALLKDPRLLASVKNGIIRKAYEEHLI